MKRTLGVALCMILMVGCGGSDSSWWDSLPNARLKVMTYNIYYGADLLRALPAMIEEDPEAIVAAVTEIVAIRDMTDFHTRAIAIANSIEEHRPHVVGLQEASIWRSQFPSDQFTASPTPATHVDLDLAQILVDELALRGLEYEAVVEVPGFEFEMPRLREDNQLEDIRITDREVILVRRDLAATPIQVVDVFGGVYETNLPLPNGGIIPAGWAGVDLRVWGQRIRVISAHPDANSEEIRYAQTMELAYGVAAADMPVVFMGDMNADATADPPLPSCELMDECGFADAWVLAGPDEAGYTFGFSEMLDDPDEEPYERLDQIRVNDRVEVLEVERVGHRQEDRVGGLWPSDHIGLVATVEVPRPAR